MESNEAAYVPAWIASDYGQEQPKPEYSSPKYRKGIYAFSHTESFGTASLITFHLSSEYERGINTHNKQVSGWHIYTYLKPLTVSAALILRITPLDLTTLVYSSGAPAD